MNLSYREQWFLDSKDEKELKHKRTDERLRLTPDQFDIPSRNVEIHRWRKIASVSYVVTDVEAATSMIDVLEARSRRYYTELCDGIFPPTCPVYFKHARYHDTTRAETQGEWAVYIEVMR